MGSPSKNGSRYDVYCVPVLQVPNSASILSLKSEVELAKKKQGSWEGRVEGKKGQHLLFYSLVTTG